MLRQIGRLNPHLKKLPQLKAHLQRQYPNAAIEVWAFDEHRVGLKPILRKVWSRVGQRPVASVHHRYEWLYAYGFVHPNSGQTEWYLLPRVNVDWLNVALKTFAQAVGAGVNKHILLVMDGAGWHRSAKLEVPQGLHIEILPPYSPELQPAERLWNPLDEPLVNRSFDSIEAIETVLVERCQTLATTMQAEIRNLTQFHWWTV